MQLALGILLGSLRDSCKLMWRLKDTFPLHVGFPGMRLYHYVRVPPSLFADSYGNAGCHIDIQMIHMHTNYYVPLHRVQLTVILQVVFFDTTSRSACSNWNGDIVPHLEPPTCISPQPHQMQYPCIGRSFPGQKKNNWLNLLRELATPCFLLCLWHFLPLLLWPWSEAFNGTEVMNTRHTR